MKIFYTVMIVLASVLNVYYYWENIWNTWAKHYIKDQDIVLSLTTTPYRINDLEHTLDCLTRQNTPVRQIYLNIPYVFKRDNSTYEIPEWLLHYPNLTILRTEDFGPATKILGTLKHAPITDDTIVIAVDDDTCYPYNMVLQLAARAKQYPDQAIGASGAELDFIKNKEGGHVKIMRDHAHVSMLEGFGGIAYRRKFFKDNIYDISREPDFCYNSDDVYISYHLAMNNVARQTVYNKFFNLRQNINQLAFGYKADALYKITKTQGDRYHQCILYLKQKFPEVEFTGNGIN